MKKIRKSDVITAIVVIAYFVSVSIGVWKRIYHLSDGYETPDIAVIWYSVAMTLIAALNGFTLYLFLFTNLRADFSGVRTLYRQLTIVFMGLAQLAFLVQALCHYFKVEKNVWIWLFALIIICLLRWIGKYFRKIPEFQTVN